jgi:glycosyltransferase involved in cell wall biosynthesis
MRLKDNAPEGPLVSVITPSLNQGAYIGQTLSSVAEQEYSRVEHIIVDGGSTDGTLDVIRSHESVYDMRWVSEPDEGMYEAINKGLRMARGEILAYLNADDRYFPWTISKVVREISAYPEAGFVFGDVFNVEEGANSGAVIFYPPFRLGHVRRSGFLGQPAVFWRRSVLEDCGGFDESLKFVADCDYWMRIGARFQSHKITEVLALERNHPEAKRFARTGDVYKELAEVRSRYSKTKGPGYQARTLANRIHAFLWRRYYFSRFLLSYLLRSWLSSDTPYAAFLTRGGEVRVSTGPVLASLLPLTRGRFAGGMVYKDLKRRGQS